MHEVRTSSRQKNNKLRWHATDTNLACLQTLLAFVNESQGGTLQFRLGSHSQWQAKSASRLIQIKTATHWVSYRSWFHTIYDLALEILDHLVWVGISLSGPVPMDRLGSTMYRIWLFSLG